MKRFLLTSSLFCIPLLSLTITDPLAQIVNGFETYLLRLPQEKIYVHFDRPYYTTGETIWFKTYLTEGPYHEPSILSHSIYVDLISDKGELVEQIKLYPKDGSASGNFVLPDTLSSGSYRVRSYTNWMRNGSPDYFFNQTIKIWNVSSVTLIDTSKFSIDIQFFPEGGWLVDEIPSKVGFKAVGTDGYGKMIKGKVLDGNKTVCEFESNELGMGVFFLTPKKGKLFKAIVDGKEGEITLPKSKETGLVMSVINTPEADNITVRILTSDFNQIKTIYLLCQTRGVVCYSAKANLTSNVSIAKIPKKGFPSGVGQITVIDQLGNPLAERLMFIDRHDEINFKIRTDKPIYSPRELIKIDIESMDATGQPLVTDLSLSVCDNEQVLIDENRGNIKTYLWLSSELVGTIEKPGYYFNPHNQDRFMALDYLLLTQGWRRFSIKEIQNNKWEFASYPVEKGLTIKGRMVDQYTGKPIPDGKVYYLSAYPNPESKTVITNTKGEFEFENTVYTDSSTAMIQGQRKNGSKAIKIIFDDKPEVALSDFSPPLLKENRSEFEKNFIANRIEQINIDKAFNFDEKSITLEAVEIVSKKEEAQTTTSRIYGKGSAAMKVSGNFALETLMHPLQLIQGRVTGVQVSGSGQTWKVLIQGVNSINSGTSPLIMVDDVPVSLDNLHTISVQDIESFTVWKGPDAAIFGVRGANGVIGFFTKRGATSMTNSNSSIFFPKKGYQREREFYSPKYDIQKPEHVKPDRRVTLFWAANIKTDSTGHASLSFYNHDLETTLTGILEGLSVNGLCGSATFNYSISKK